MLRLRLITVVFLTLGLTASASGPPDTVQQSVAAIFADAHIQDSALYVCKRAATMSSEERLEYLADWVLPCDSHSTFRLSMDFTPVNPVPVVDAERDSEDGSPIDEKSSQRRIVVGGDLVSPGIDLVNAAREQGVLPDLKARIRNCPANDATAARCRRTMMILTEITDGQFNVAQEQLAELHSRFVQLDRSQVTTRCPETLAISVGLQHSQTRDLAQELLSYIVESFIHQERSGSQDVWDRQMAALVGWAKSRANLSMDAAAVSEDQALQNWIPVSRMTARSRGVGFPRGRWEAARGLVRNFASHDQDYLYFLSPLRGDFQVECDVTSFGWRNSHLAIAGQWVAPVWGMRTYEIGDFRQARPYIDISPPLSVADDWIRYRTVVRDGTAVTHFNGRRVHSESLDAHHEPWIAIRSPWYADGEVRDLRITGQPAIPHQLNLSASPGLPGWISYQNVNLGTDWRQSVAAESGGLIIGQKRSEDADTGYESLIQYNRPMLEDGTIEYDFFYEEGKVHVHPALDRLTFLLQPDGVRIHHVTDGPWDATGADPLSVHDEPDSRRGPARLPLRQHAWNHLKLSLAGDTVQLMLNNELVFERDLEATNQRTFGLFHYADQTEARIANVTWIGDWPKVLPPDVSQELANPKTLFPELALKDVFRHDFAKSGMPTNLFSAGGFDLVGNKRQVDPEGLKLHSESLQDFNHCFITPNLEVRGDFDIIAAFENLKTTASGNGDGGASLGIVLTDVLSTHCTVYRGFVRRPGAPDRQTAHLYLRRTKAKESRQSWLGNISEESNSGRLRLIRHGRMLHSLIAEGDSPHFRLVCSEEVPDDNLIPGGIRVIVHGQASETSVVIKNIEVRAAELSGPAMEDTEERLAELNQQRDELAQRFAHDFTTTPPASTDFIRWTDTESWNEADGGLSIVCPGNVRWETAGFSVMKAISGNFDIQTRFNVIDLPTPAPGLLSNVIVQITFRNDDRLRPTLVINKRNSGQTKVQAEGWEPQPNGGFVYRQFGSVELEADSLTGFRLVRRDDKMAFVVSSKEFARDRVIATATVPDIPVLPSDLVFRVHAGGAGRETKVLLSLFDIRATEVSERLIPQ